MLKQKDWSTQARRALTAPELVAKLAQMDGWQLHGDGADVAITKTFRFDDYHETMAFVNAVAFIAHTQDHHPDLSVHYNRCVVRFNTHDVQGLSPRAGLGLMQAARDLDAEEGADLARRDQHRSTGGEADHHGMRNEIHQRAHARQAQEIGRAHV